MSDNNDIKLLELLFARAFEASFPGPVHEDSVRIRAKLSERLDALAQLEAQAKAEATQPADEE